MPVEYEEPACDEPLVQSTKRTAAECDAGDRGVPAEKTLKRFAFAQGFDEQMRLGLKT